MGTKLLHARPYSPESKGKVEKFFRYVDLSFTNEANLLINQGKLFDLKQLNIYLHSWLETYDNRVHRSTKQTPKQRYEKDTSHIRHLTTDELKEIFLWEGERTVRKTSVIEVEGNLYEVDSFLRGKRIQIRYNPFDLSLIRVYRDGTRYDDAKAAIINNKHHPKMPNELEEQSPGFISSYLENLKKEQEERRRKELGTTSFTKLEDKKRGEIPC